MKKLGTWAASFIPALVLAFFGAYWALSFLWQTHDRSMDLGLIIYPLIASPIFIIAHSVAYVALKGRTEKMWIPIVSAALIAPLLYSVSVFLIAKSQGYT